MARDGERGRGDWRARLGSPSSGPYAEDAGDSAPVDIAEVRRDDALIDAIAGDGPVATDSDQEFQLASLLADWRAEIVEAPMPAGPDLDTVVAAVNQEIGARTARVGANRRGALRLVRPLMGAAAAVAVIAGGTTAFSYGASPGDPLWRVKEVVFSQQAQSTIAQSADNDMTKAQSLIEQGHPEQAKALMQTASTSATQVSDNARKQNLQTRWQELLGKLRDQAPDVAAALQPKGPGPDIGGIPLPGTSIPMLPGAPTSADRPSKPGQQGRGDSNPMKPTLPGPEIMRGRLPDPNHPGTGTTTPGSGTSTGPGNHPGTGTTGPSADSKPGSGAGNGEGTGGGKPPVTIEPPTMSIPTGSIPTGQAPTHKPPTVPSAGGESHPGGSLPGGTLPGGTGGTLPGGTLPGGIHH
ncbi:MAG: hypothetical protein J2P18_14675 [Nocardia sp.]|nr:hypothetical protein [Nocardia sp.]